MAATAYQNQYRQEFIAGFEQDQTLLRQATTNEAVIKGNVAIFLVADSNAATTVTRGVDGLIPARPDNLTQVSCTLTEEHDLVRRSGFNLFASQGDGRRIMQHTSRSVINRKVDSQILTALADTTYCTGTAAATASLDMVMWASSVLGVNQVPTTDGNITGVISPAFYAYLMQTPEFAKNSYVNNKPFSGQPTMFQWANVNWVVHNNISGVGTSSEKCYLFHKNAVGHALDTSGMQIEADYHREQDYSWARSSAYMGAKLIQAKGVVLMRHDGSKYAYTA